MSIFQREIIDGILSRLPVKSLMRFRCVSKSWLEVIDGPDFIKTHLKQAHLSDDVKIMLNTDDYIYSIDIVNGNLVVDLQRPRETLFWSADEILCSCNGLLLVMLGDVFTFIWNPSNGEYERLPDTPPTEFSGSYLCMAYGFGYDSITNDYKVVEVHSRDYNHDNDDEVDGVDFDNIIRHSEAKVYSLALNSWKIIPNFPYECIDRTGNLLNGAVHWEAIRSNTLDKSRLIISFDIGNEEFQEVPLPEFKDGKELGGVSVLAGSLCILCFCTLDLEVWAMRHYGVRESWTKFFTIGQPVYNYHTGYTNPLCVFKNGEILLDKGGNCLILYDPKDGRVRNICIRGLSSWNEMEIYVESLVTLKTEESEWNGRIEEEIPIPTPPAPQSPFQAPPQPAPLQYPHGYMPQPYYGLASPLDMPPYATYLSAQLKYMHEYMTRIFTDIDTRLDHQGDCLHRIEAHMLPPR
ncbi:hypothetical protein Sjap_011013 [Stephania japonica]|uniref:F-box domain-containing protein n=1 Tax=Stephania japonica TaxID=461633 RepID=A0AAP0P7Q1_9MAGN